MTDTATMPNFRRGVDESAKASAGGGSFARTHYFRIEKSGERKVIRLLTEALDWIVVDQYQYLPTKPKPDGWEGNWPSRMGAVSRSDKALKGMFADDYIAEHMRDKEGKPYKPSARTWALAVEREEVIGDGTEEMGGPAMKGKVLGYRDATREVKRKKEGSDEEETIIEKAIVVVNMGYKNFFSALDGSFRVYGTVLDRDYVVVRKGSGTDTDYQIVGLTPIPSEEAEGGIYDIRDPKIAARYGMIVVDAVTDPSDAFPEGMPYKSVQPGPEFPGPKLSDVIMSMCSDEYIGRFFDPRVTVEQKKGSEASNGGAPVEQQSKPEVEATDDKIAAMAARVKDYSGAQPAPAGDGSAEATPVGAQRNFD